MKPPFRDDVLPIVFASPTDLKRLDTKRPRWDAMALTWEQRLARQLLFVNCDTLQVERQAFLDAEQPWIRADDGLLHTPNLKAVDDPIIPVGISTTTWELCTSFDTLPQIHLCVEAITADLDDFHDNIEPETMLLEDSYAVDLIVGGVQRNRNDADHVRELDFRSLVTEYRQNNVRLVDEPYSKLPHPWNKWVPAEKHDSLLALLNS